MAITSTTDYPNVNPTEGNSPVTDAVTAINAAGTANLTDIAAAGDSEVADVVAAGDAAQASISGSVAAAAASEVNAAASEANAAASEANAATSETNAANSDTAAEYWAVTAAASADAALGAGAGANYVKTPVFLATTQNITLTGEQVIDGVQTAGSSVLVHLQDDSEDNGIYTSSAGAWTRRADADDAAEIAGAQVLVRDGLTQRGRVFRLISSITTLGTDPQKWINVEGGGGLQEAAGQTRGVLATLGDSNYGGRPGFRSSMVSEWRDPGGAFENWTHYNIGVSGYTVGTGAISTIASGNKAAPPADYTAGGGLWDGNIWEFVNSQADVGIVSLGINDMNSPATRSTYGSPENFRANFETVMLFLLTAMPRTNFLLQIPAPYAGEDFVITGFNTDWAADAPAGEPTIDGNAAYRSSVIRAVYLEWAARHPRVNVWDSAELFGVRCDDPLVDSQDPETGEDLIDDSLHFSDLGARRIVQYLTRKMGVSRRRTKLAVPITDEAMCENTFWSEQFFCVGASNSGANTLLALRTSPGSFFWKDDRLQTRGASAPVPMSGVEDGYLAEVLGNRAAIRELLALRGSAIKVKFLGSGTTYTGGPVSLSSVVTDADGEKQYKVQLNGVNMGSEIAGQQIIIWVESTAHLPFIQKASSFNIDGTGGGGAIHNQWAVNWTPTVFTFARGVGTNAITVSLYAQNGNDGRMVDGSPVYAGDLPSTPYSPPGVLVAEGAISNGIYQGTLTLNATDFPSGFFGFKSSYRLVGRVTSGTLIGQGTITVRE